MCVKKKKKKVIGKKEKNARNPDGEHTPVRFVVGKKKKKKDRHGEDFNGHRITYVCVGVGGEEGYTR